MFSASRPPSRSCRASSALCATDQPVDACGVLVKSSTDRGTQISRRCAIAYIPAPPLVGPVISFRAGALNARCGDVDSSHATRPSERRCDTGRKRNKNKPKSHAVTARMRWKDQRTFPDPAMATTAVHSSGEAYGQGPWDQACHYQGFVLASATSPLTTRLRLSSHGAGTDPGYS